MTGMDDLRVRLEAAAAQNFGAALGSVVRAIDIWEKDPAARPEPWALEARDAVIAHIEFLAEEQAR